MGSERHQTVKSFPYQFLRVKESGQDEDEGDEQQGEGRRRQPTILGDLESALKTSLFANDEEAKQAITFVPRKPFEPSLIYVKGPHYP